MSASISTAIPEWAAEMALLDARDSGLPDTVPGVNCVLNRARLAHFLAEFGADPGRARFAVPGLDLRRDQH
jgi:hypothetical protein